MPVLIAPWPNPSKCCMEELHCPSLAPMLNKHPQVPPKNLVGCAFQSDWTGNTGSSSSVLRFDSHSRDDKYSAWGGVTCMQRGKLPTFNFVSCDSITPSNDNQWQEIHDFFMSVSWNMSSKWLLPNYLCHVQTLWSFLDPKPKKQENDTNHLSLFTRADWWTLQQSPSIVQSFRIHSHQSSNLIPKIMWWVKWCLPLREAIEISVAPL